MSRSGRIQPGRACERGVVRPVQSGAMTDTRLWDRAAPTVQTDGRRRPGSPRCPRPCPASTSCSTSCATPSCASRPCGCASRSTSDHARRGRHVSWTSAPTSRPREGHDQPAGQGPRSGLRDLDLRRRPRPDLRGARTNSAPSARCATGRAASTKPTSRACPGSTNRSRRSPWRLCRTRSSTRPAIARTCSRRADAWSPAAMSSGAERRSFSNATTRAPSRSQPTDPDFHISIAVDRQPGVILRLVESIGGETTRHAEVTDLGPDAPLPPAAFDFLFPTGTTMLY